MRETLSSCGDGSSFLVGMWVLVCPSRDADSSMNLPPEAAMMDE
eukprot:CAMPEP_0204616210 /NCGR_PEP_ID=MMETSP0717-20131115/3510_1 /ASSEMBLY_ACC=CAM_ASM_000666 /TAXON_ID=230516 /ORGANISM="Chaetoceros curvisetus" /LENGTH=43 /DNA_ID= /DNA_START= /DNA_END= /DNA_ORIENTATION=